MSFASDCLRQIARLDERWRLPRVRALHLPPDPAPGEPRGEFCALELDDGTLGLSYVLLDDTLARLRAADPSLGLAGVPALEVARQLADGVGARRALGLAAVNAASRWFFDRAGWQPDPSIDSIGALDPRPGEHVGMIGLFTPLIPRVLAAGARLTVVELKPQLAGDRDGWRVTLDARELLDCDKVLSTGTLLLNDTLERMLALCRRARVIAMVGPSVGCLPDALFDRGVTLLGGTWVLDAAAYVDALRAGEQRQGLARKVATVRDTYPGFDALLARLAAG
jgi:uncharacterized protein (DUF4213/DUF364 family)